MEGIRLRKEMEKNIAEDKLNTLEDKKNRQNNEDEINWTFTKTKKENV